MITFSLAGIVKLFFTTIDKELLIIEKILSKMLLMIVKSIYTWSEEE